MNLKSLSTLHIALGVSVLVHAAVLTLRIVDPEGFNRVVQDTPLEVVLVNAHSNEKVDRAQAIAQRSLAGGGEADKGRATSPLPPSALSPLAPRITRLTSQPPRPVRLLRPSATDCPVVRARPE